MTAGAIDRLPRREIAEIVDRHVVPSAEVDAAMTHAAPTAGLLARLPSCGRLGNSPTTATRALTSTAS